MLLLRKEIREVWLCSHVELLVYASYDVLHYFYSKDGAWL